MVSPCRVWRAEVEEEEEAWIDGVIVICIRHRHACLHNDNGSLVVSY